VLNRVFGRLRNALADSIRGGAPHVLVLLNGEAGRTQPL
jgi:hypothetical protein